MHRVCTTLATKLRQLNFTLNKLLILARPIVAALARRAAQLDHVLTEF